MLENVQVYRNFPAAQILRITGGAAFQTLHSLLSPAQTARLQGRPVVAVRLLSTSGNLDVATVAVPDTDIHVQAAAGPALDLPIVGGLHQVWVRGAGVTANLMVFCG